MLTALSLLVLSLLTALGLASESRSLLAAEDLAVLRTHIAVDTLVR
jgi:hypothetical protein